MTAIERFHKLLDERGVEYEDAYGITLWTGADGCAYTAIEMVSLSMKPSEKLMVRRILTPEQAIAATLGPGTCKYEVIPNIGNGYLDAFGMRCTFCGREQMSLEPPNFCPNCGRKVVDA